MTGKVNDRFCFAGVDCVIVPDTAGADAVPSSLNMRALPFGSAKNKDPSWFAGRWYRSSSFLLASSASEEPEAAPAPGSMKR